MSENRNNLVCISDVRGYEKDGVAHLHIEDVARGLGFTEQKDGVEYVRWRTVDSHLSSLAFATCCENGNPHDYYIPENVFYRLCMKAKNAVAEAFQAKVADEIIPSIRKTGSYSVKEQHVMLPNFCNPAEAARAWADLYEKNQAIERRALTAEAQRDEAIRTKSMIGSRREATSMATASAKSRECAKLTAENAELKDAIGRGTNWRTIAMMKDEWTREFGHAPVWQKLKQFSAYFPVEMKPVRDVEEKVILPNGREKVNISYRYHREAWAKYREYEESLRSDVV